MSGRRLKVCIEAWPECEEGEYNPACCRFPKSCSCRVYSNEYITEDQLESYDRDVRVRCPNCGKRTTIQGVRPEDDPTEWGCGDCAQAQVRPRSLYRYVLDDEVAR